MITDLIGLRTSKGLQWKGSICCLEVGGDCSREMRSWREPKASGIVGNVDGRKGFEMTIANMLTDPIPFLGSRLPPSRESFNHPHSDGCGTTQRS
jgi:hypothetical protein